MGIHIHTKGRPDMCRCCAIVDRLNELWDRTHNSVLSVNGIYADGNGAIVIPGIQDISDLRQQVADDRQYLEAVAEDLVTNYATKSALQSLSASASATQTQLTNLANELNNVHPYMTTNTEQTITAAKYLSVIGESVKSAINKEWVSATAPNKANNLLHENESVSAKLVLNGSDSEQTYVVQSTNLTRGYTGQYTHYGAIMHFTDKSGNPLAGLRAVTSGTGQSVLELVMYSASGSPRIIELGRSA